MRSCGALLVALVAAPLGACAFDGGGIQIVDGGGPPDDDGGGQPDADDRTCVPWQASNVEPCSALLAPPAPLILVTGTFTYNTETGVLSAAGGGPSRSPPSSIVDQPGGRPARVINLTTLSVAAAVKLTIAGTSPLILVVHGDATYDGSLSVSSVAAQTPFPGPGANDALCTDSIGEPGGAAGALSGAGGAGGGAFSDDGGDGTDGDGGDPGGKGDKGGKGSDLDLVPLRGGCRGGKGGNRAPQMGGGNPGQGGGAVEITVRGVLSVGGEIAANGSAGRGGGPGAGGGGGGSGGAIFLEAGTVAIKDGAALCANGGAGGEGAEGLTAGDAGDDGTCANAAAGGGSGGDGGDGGTGGFLGEGKGGTAIDATEGASGGGGGGSVGLIRLRGIGGPPTIGTVRVITPAPRTN